MADQIANWLKDKLIEANALTGPTPTIGHQLSRVGLAAGNLLYEQAKDAVNALELPGKVFHGEAAPSVDNAAAFGLTSAGLGLGGSALLGGVDSTLGSTVTNLGHYKAALSDAAVRKNNLKQLVDQGYFGTHELPNGYSIGKSIDTPDPTFGANTTHVLISPQGVPVLYGKSPADLIKRGFPDDEQAGLLPETNPTPMPAVTAQQNSNILTFPVDHNPFSQTLEPVDHNPFETE